MLRSHGPSFFAAPEFTDEEAADKSTQQLLSSRCIFQNQPDGSVVGLTGGARELMRRSDEYMKFVQAAFLSKLEAVHDAAKH